MRPAVALVFFLAPLAAGLFFAPAFFAGAFFTVLVAFLAGVFFAAVVVVFAAAAFGAVAFFVVLRFTAGFSVAGGAGSAAR